MKKWTKMTALAMTAVLLGSGCTSAPEEGRTSPDESVVYESEVEYPEYWNKLSQITPAAYSDISDLKLAPGSYISIIGKDKEGPFWKELMAGVKQAQDDINANLGYEGKDAVKVNYDAPDKYEDVDTQVNLLDEELDMYPVALAISILDVQACEVQFDLAYNNGIPIICFDSGSSYSGFSARVATDNDAAARECADHMAEVTGGEGRVVVFAHESNSEAALVRAEAFADQINKKYDGMKVATVFYPDKINTYKERMIKRIKAGKYQRKDSSGNPIEETGEDLTADDISLEDVEDYILLRKKNLTGVYATNGDSIDQAAEALERNGLADVHLMGFDITDKVKEGIENGTVDGAILQNPFGMGYATVVAAARAALGMGNQDYIDSQYKWITSENINTEEIQGLIY